MSLSSWIGSVVRSSAVLRMFVYLIRCDKVAQTQEQQCVRKSRSGTNNLHKYQEGEKEKKEYWENMWVMDGEKCMPSLHLEEVGRLR